MRNKIAAGSVLLLVFLVVFLSGYHPYSDKAVASVAKHIISVDDFKARMVQRSGGMTQYFETLENKQNLINEMVDYEVQLQAARQASLENDPEVKAAIERVLVSSLRNRQLDQIQQQVSVDASEIEAFYQQNISKYTTPEKVRAAIIKFSLSPNASKEKQSEIKALAEKVHKDAAALAESVRGFGALAAKHSEHQSSRYIGGDIGWLVKGKEYAALDAAVLESLNHLNDKKRLAPVIKAVDGFYLVKLIDKKAEQVMPVAQVERNIRQIILRNKHEQAESEWMRSLRNRVSPIYINMDLLKSVKPSAISRPQQDAVHPPALPKG